MYTFVSFLFWAGVLCSATYCVNYFVVFCEASEKVENDPKYKGANYIEKRIARTEAMNAALKKSLVHKITAPVWDMFQYVVFTLLFGTIAATGWGICAAVIASPILLCRFFR